MCTNDTKYLSLWCVGNIEALSTSTDWHKYKHPENMQHGRMCTNHAPLCSDTWPICSIALVYWKNRLHQQAQVDTNLSSWKSQVSKQLQINVAWLHMRHYAVILYIETYTWMVSLWINTFSCNIFPLFSQCNSLEECMTNWGGSAF